MEVASSQKQAAAYEEVQLRVQSSDELCIRIYLAPDLFWDDFSVGSHIFIYDGLFVA